MKESLGRVGPNPIDVHVGLRIKLRRNELSMSQERLAETIRLTPQQVQKYERAANRVSASKLVEIARALKAPVAYFFEGLDKSADLAAAGWITRNALLASSPQISDLAEVWPKVSSRDRRAVVGLVRALAGDRNPA